MHEDIDIGTLILDKLKENGQAVSWLAEKINSDRSNFYRILKRNHIDTKLLMDISRALNFDFFAYYSEHLQKSKTENK
jgi:predicted transcriptional regulator